MVVSRVCRGSSFRLGVVPSEMLDAARDPAHATAELPFHDQPPAGSGDKTHSEPQSLHIGDMRRVAGGEGQTHESNFCDDLEMDLPMDLFGGTSTGIQTASLAHALHENITVSGAVPLEAYDYYQVRPRSPRSAAHSLKNSGLSHLGKNACWFWQVCVATHPTHHHRVQFTLQCPAHNSNADL